MTYERGYGESEVYLLFCGIGAWYDMVSDTGRFGVYEIDTQGFALVLLLFAMAHGWEQKGGAWRWSIALYPRTDWHLHLHQAYLVPETS